MPGERIAALRAAFEKLVKDPELIAEAKKRHMPLAGKSAAETHALVVRTLGAPPAIIAVARKALALE